MKLKENKIALFLFLALAAVALAGRAGADGGGVMPVLEEALRTELVQTVSPDVELMGVRIVKGGESLSPEARYSVTGLSMTGYSGSNRPLFLVSLMNRKRETAAVTVEASFDILREAFVPSRRLSAGTVLTEGDFYAVKQKSSRLPAGAVTDRGALEGKIVKTALGQGVIIKTDHLTSHISVKRGQRVDIVVEGTSVVLSTKGVLKGDAVVGGTARVVCDNSRKEVSGILIAPQTVKVKI